MGSDVKQDVLEDNLRMVELWREDLVDFQGLTPHTVTNYVGDGRRAAEILAAHGTRFTGLNRLALRAYFTAVQQEADRPEGLSHARMKGLFTALNSLMEFLVYEEHTLANPVPAFRKRYLKPYKADASSATPRQVPSDEDIRALIQSVQDPMHRAIHMVFAKTGIRRGELCSLNLESVDLVEGRLTLPPKRKRSGRLIPIDLELATVLTAYLNRLPLYARAEGERALFTGRTGKRIGRNRVYDIVVTPAIRAGLHDTSTDRLEQHTKFTPHHYRHWLTTKLRQNGCSERVIRAIRGDADHSTADRYDHVTWETIQSEYAASVVNIVDLLK